MTAKGPAIWQKIPKNQILIYSTLLCLTSVLGDWFGWGAPSGQPPVASWTGISFLGVTFYLAVPLCFLAIFLPTGFQRWVGILGHGLWELSYAIAFYEFPVQANLTKTPSLSTSLIASQPILWIGVIVILFNLFLFLYLMPPKSISNKNN